MATPTGFSIKSLVSTIRSQDPNVDIEDAKAIAEQIRDNLFKSLLGAKPIATRNTNKKAKEEKKEQKETYRTPDGKFTSFNKLIENNLKEIKSDLKKNNSSLSTVEKNSSEIKKSIDKIIEDIAAERMAAKKPTVQNKSYSLVSIGQLTQKTVNKIDSGERVGKGKIEVEIKKIQEQNKTIIKNVSDIRKDVKHIKDKIDDRDEEQEKEKKAEEKYRQEDLEKKLDLMLKKVEGEKKNKGIFGNLLDSLENFFTKGSGSLILDGLKFALKGVYNLAKLALRGILTVGKSLAQAGYKGLQWLVANPEILVPLGLSAGALYIDEKNKETRDELKEQIKKAVISGDRKKVEELIKTKKYKDIATAPAAPGGAPMVDYKAVSSDIQKEVDEAMAKSKEFTKELTENTELKWDNLQSDLASHFLEKNIDFKVAKIYKDYYDELREKAFTGKLPANPPSLTDFLIAVNPRVQARLNAKEIPVPKVETAATSTSDAETKAERVPESSVLSGPAVDIGPVDTNVENILKTIRTKESGGDYKIKTKLLGSNASGAYQFIASTWKSLTKKYGIGTEYAEAYMAPPDVQDAIARKLVQEILEKNNGDIRAVPNTWYTGNAQGNLSTEAIRINNNLTPEAYANSWLKTYKAVSGTGGTENEPESVMFKSGESHVTTLDLSADTSTPNITSEQRRQIYEAINMNPKARAEEQKMEKDININDKRGQAEYDIALYRLAEKYNMLEGVVKNSVKQTPNRQTPPPSPAAPAPTARNYEFSQQHMILGATDLTINKFSIS